MKSYAIEIKWGIIFVVATLLWMLLEKYLGWHDENIADHAIYTNLFAAIAIGIYVLALFDKRKNYYRGVMSWKQGFAAGVVITLIVTILTPLTQYLVHEFISPNFFDNMITYAVETNQASREDAEATFNLNSYLLQAIMGALVMGLITSALIALIMKRKRVES